MGITSLDVARFIGASEYIFLVDDLVATHGVKVDKTEPVAAIRNICAGEFNRANNIVGVGLNDLLETLVEDREKLERFFILICQLSPDPDGGFYPTEEPGLDEQSSNITFDPYPLSFMFGFLIKYHILKYFDSNIFDYLKALKIPGAKKHADELRKIYREVAL